MALDEAWHQNAVSKIDVPIGTAPRLGANCVSNRKYPPVPDSDMGRAGTVPIHRQNLTCLKKRDVGHGIPVVFVRLDSEAWLMEKIVLKTEYLTKNSGLPVHFTLKQLQYFDAALRAGSIAKASVEMNISQSSITAAIDMIEKSTKTELLRRMPAKGIVATDKGLEIGARIREFLEQARIFEADLLTLTGDPSGTLRLGCYAPTAPYVLPPILKRISQNFPHIRVEIKEGDMQSIAEFLNSGVVDLALTYRRAAPKSQPFLPMFKAAPIALVPDVSPLARQPEVTLAELADLPMILLDLPGAPEYFANLFAAQGLAPKVAHTTKSSSVLRGMVGADLGYALLNIAGPLDRQGQNGYVAKPIKGRHDSPYYGVAYTGAGKRSVLVRSVLETCQEIADQEGFAHLLATVSGR